MLLLSANAPFLMLWGVYAFYQYHHMKALFVSTLLFLKLAFLPDFNMLTLLFFCMVIDFLTGIWKAKVKKQVRTSEGYKRTVTKFIQYAFALLAAYALAYVANENGSEGMQILAPYLIDGLAVFIIYIEVTSVFENLYAIDSSTMISKFFFKPILSILTFQIKNNPVVKHAEGIEETNQ